MLAKPSIQFPNCLYGEKTVVRKNIKRICRTAWAADSWDAVAQEVQMIDFSSQPAWIVLSHLDSRLHWPKVRWNLNWISEEMQSLADKHDDPERLTRLNLEGMQDCWYAIAMLSPDSQGTWGEVCDESRTAYRQVLSRYVRWLPEFISLRSWLTHDDLREPELQLDLTWAYMIVSCVNRLGVALEINEIYNQFNGCIETALLSLAVIEPDEDRYRMGKAVA